jgi:glycosyltransferase 2 family protein
MSLNNTGGADKTGRADSVPPNRQRKGNFWRVLGTVLSIGLLLYVIWSQGWEEILNALKDLPFFYVLIAFGLVLVSRFAVTLRWYSLLRTAKVNIPFKQALRLVFMGLFSSNFLPSTVGGDLVRLAGAIYLGLDAGISAASLVVDRLIGMAGMATFLPFGLSAFVQAGGAGSAGSGAVGGLITGQVLAVGFSPIGLTRKLYQRGLKFLKSLVRSSIYWIKHPASLGLAFVCTLVHMAMTFLVVKILLAGMGEQLSFWWIGGLWSCSYFISLMPVSINGLGLQEVSIAYLYSHFGGVPLHTSLALAALMRLLPMLASLPGVFFLPDILRPLPRSLSAAADPHTDLSPESSGSQGGLSS